MNVLNHEEEYRGKDLIKKVSESQLIVCGCGAVGSNFIDGAIRQGFKKIRVIDMDRVEDHNRATQVWDRRCVGQFKTAAIAQLAYSSMGVSIDAVNRRLEENNLKKLLSFGLKPVVVDGFDNVESRTLIKEYCEKNGIDCMHIGLAQNSAEVAWNEEYLIPPAMSNVDVCDYPLARNVAILAVTVGLESLLSFIESGEKRSFSITLRDLKITPYRC